MFDCFAMNSNGQFEVHCDCAGSSTPIDAHNTIKEGKFEVLSATLEEKEMITGALLDAKQWLPFAAEKYMISPSLNDYVLLPSIAMISDLPNRNNVAFPFKELSAFNPDRGMIAYKGWKAMPAHLEHCFVGNTIINTETGFKKIKDIKVGDYVLTHNNKYRKVITTYNNGVKPIKYVETWGTLSYLLATENHPVWVVDRRQIIKENLSSCKQKGLLGKDRYIPFNQLKPHFRPLSDVYMGDFLVQPIYAGGKISVEPEFAFLAGVYTAEGSFEKCKTDKTKLCATVFTIGFSEHQFEQKIIDCCKKLNLKYSTYHYGPATGRNVRQIRVSSYEFSAKLKELCGEYSREKRLSKELLSWDKESLFNFVGGMIEGDGCVTASRGSYRYTTTSYYLAKDLLNILAFLGIRSATSRERSDEEITRLIQGITEPPHSKPYCISICPDSSYLLNPYMVTKKVKHIEKKHSEMGGVVYNLLSDNYVLYPVKRIIDAGNENVYNLEVEEDNSYVANGFIVHNCNKDITQAKGVIFDSVMRPLKGYKGNLWKVILLTGFDRTKDSVLVNDILTGKRPSTSMGAYCEDYTCSICGASLKAGGCGHITKGDPTYKIYDGKLACWNTKSINPFENSSVINPAYTYATNEKHFDMFNR